MHPPIQVEKLLAATKLPTEIPCNPLGGASIRTDASFDHLSLLSIRDPATFAKVEVVVANHLDPICRRLTAHCSYIRQHFLEAGTIYAQLLCERPDDLDLWRDTSWAARHAGYEELTRAWVLDPVAVTQIASAVEWRLAGNRPSTLEPATEVLGPLGLVLDLLGWVS